MGGKNVAIVMPDADLRPGGGAHRRRRDAIRRPEVHGDEPRRRRARSRRTRSSPSSGARSKALPLGPVTDADAAVGPRDQRAVARRDPARARRPATPERVYRRQRPDTAEFANGWFLPPTVLSRRRRPTRRSRSGSCSARCSRCSRRDDLDDARRAGERHAVRAERIAVHARPAQRAAYIDRIEAGLVRVNGDTTGVDPHAPFGGMKGSSSGSREQGAAAREFYTEIKTVQINPDAMHDSSATRFGVVDSHTEGEPTRVVIDGWPQPAGATMAERRDDLRAQLRSSASRGGLRAARPRCRRRRAAHAAGHAPAPPPASCSSTTAPTSACAATASSASCARSSTSDACSPAAPVRHARRHGDAPSSRDDGARHDRERCRALPRARRRGGRARRRAR